MFIFVELTNVEFASSVFADGDKDGVVAGITDGFIEGLQDGYIVGIFVGAPFGGSVLKIHNLYVLSPWICCIWCKYKWWVDVFIF